MSVGQVFIFKFIYLGGLACGQYYPCTGEPGLYKQDQGTKSKKQPSSVGFVSSSCLVPALASPDIGL